jgi:hypothetical protein
VCLSYSLSKDTGVFSVEEQIDAGKFTVFFILVVPDSSEDVTFSFIRVD